MKKKVAVIIIVVISIMLCACSSKKINDSASLDNHNTETNTIERPETLGSSLKLIGSVSLMYAKEFAIDYYCTDGDSDIYKLITIPRTGRYLVVPDDNQTIMDIIKDIPDDITIIEEPDSIYLAATQVMDMFANMEAMDKLRFSTLKQEDWYIEAARDYMRQGKLIYAGKYSTPDYELILEQHCDLAIENTMIYHSPEVKEKLESFGIPVLVDCSSYEREPLGRSEWVKLYGALIGYDEVADELFNNQVNECDKELAKLSLDEKPTVAYFYIASNGQVKARRSTDYVPRMIELAGGQYIFKDLGNDIENASSTVSLSMEQFYADAKDADYIIYNSTIDGELDSIDGLVAKCELLSGMRAVQENHVYCTSANLFQSTMEIGTIIADIHKALAGDDSMTFLYRLK